MLYNYNHIDLKVLLAFAASKYYEFFGLPILTTLCLLSLKLSDLAVRNPLGKYPGSFIGFSFASSSKLQMRLWRFSEGVVKYGQNELNLYETDGSHETERRLTSLP